MSEDKSLALEIVRTLQERGHLALLVGGCVRDELLETTPKDYDVVTTATPEQMESWFSKTVAVGKSFGTLTVVRGAAQVQVSTARNCKAAGHIPADDAEVRRLLEDDASDRDFTFNAIFRDPISGSLYDFFGGQGDLAAGRIQTVGNATERFRKDRLRMLRSVRFASTLGFTITPEVLAAVRDLAPEISQVSFERVRDELKKMLTKGNPVAGLDLMMETGLMKEIIPEIMAMLSAEGEQDPVWHPEGDVWVHSRMVVKELTGGSFELLLGALLHDVGKPATQQRLEGGRISNRGHAEVGAKMAKRICARLKISNEETQRICDLVGLHMKMHDVARLRTGKLAKLLERPDIHDLIALQHADAVGTTCDCKLEKSMREFLLAKLSEQEKQEEIAPFAALITGDLLISLGYSPGPAFREILEEGSCAQREGAFSTIDAATVWLQQRYGS